jgi:protein-disulfide isomerase
MSRIATAALMAAVFLFPVMGQAPRRKATPARAAGATSVSPVLDKKNFEIWVRHLEGIPADVTVTVPDPVASKRLPGYFDVLVRASRGQASAEFAYLLSPDGKSIVKGTAFALGKNPFAENISRLKTEFAASMGTPGAKVVLVLFSDFQCTFCRQFAQSLEQNLMKEFPKDVRLYFKDFPIEQIHPWAMKASMAAACVLREKPLAFWDVHNWIFANQEQINPENAGDKIAEFAATKGVDAAKLKACVDSRETEQQVKDNRQQGIELGVNSTPTIFVNGRPLAGNVAWTQLKQIIQMELDYQNATGGTGDVACCSTELKLPGRN